MKKGNLVVEMILNCSIKVVNINLEYHDDSLCIIITVHVYVITIQDTATAYSSEVPHSTSIPLLLWT